MYFTVFMTSHSHESVSDVPLPTDFPLSDTYSVVVDMTLEFHEVHEVPP